MKISQNDYHAQIQYEQAKIYASWFGFNSETLFKKLQELDLDVTSINSVHHVHLLENRITLRDSLSQILFMDSFEMLEEFIGFKLSSYKETNKKVNEERKIFEANRKYY